MPFTDSYAHGILNYTFAKVKALYAPSAVYIGLCTNDPEEDKGAINELPDADAYHRVLLSLTTKDGISPYPDIFDGASERKMVNKNQINWTKATAAWPRVKGFFLSSSDTVGETANIFFYGALDLPTGSDGLDVPRGAVALFDPEAFTIEFPETDKTEEEDAE